MLVKIIFHLRRLGLESILALIYVWWYIWVPMCLYAQHAYGGQRTTVEVVLQVPSTFCDTNLHQVGPASRICMSFISHCAVDGLTGPSHILQFLHWVFVLKFSLHAFKSSLDRHCGICLESQFFRGWHRWTMNSRPGQLGPYQVWG